jgi:hypothetical protein
VRLACLLLSAGWLWVLVCYGFASCVVCTSPHPQAFKEVKRLLAKSSGKL